mgnify:CR=1 FL=1
MRKYLLSVLLVAFSGITLAQVVHENETSVVYYMPKTEFIITLSYDRVEHEPGVFYQYAQRYLGTTDIILEKKVNYLLQDIQLTTQAVADTTRVYKIPTHVANGTCLVSLSHDGRLLGYNCSTQPAINTTQPAINSTQPAINTTPHNAVLPLLEEQFMAGSVAKMAEGAAKQIYRIRETRLNLLAGEVEHVPADGEAMKLVLEELEHQEQLLTELFVGRKSITHKTHTFSYVPTDNTENEIICRFSVHSGIVATDDLSGEPIYLSVQAKKQELGGSIEISSKTPTLSQLYYNIPGEGKIHVTYKGKDLLNTSYPIAQWGVAVPMSRQLFIGKQPVTIHSNPETGNILSIQQ